MALTRSYESKNAGFFFPTGRWGKTTPNKGWIAKLKRVALTNACTLSCRFLCLPHPTPHPSPPPSPCPHFPKDNHPAAPPEPTTPNPSSRNTTRNSHRFAKSTPGKNYPWFLLERFSTCEEGRRVRPGKLLSRTPTTNDEDNPSTS